jgi:hypothetical protein
LISSLAPSGRLIAAIGWQARKPVLVAGGVAARFDILKNIFSGQDLLLRESVRFYQRGALST